MSKQLCDLNTSQCVACEGGIEKNTGFVNQSLLKDLHKDWQLNETGDQLHRNYKFKNFAKTMFFVNAVAHIADQQFHHPDVEFGYNYCTIKYSTHAVNGLTVNDFICAALIDKL
jgi:4a-hydroxytetrahydrobiopterin dehydratase